jgi:hypothetical protein
MAANADLLEAMRSRVATAVLRCVQGDNKIVGLVYFAASTEANIIVSHPSIIDALVELNVTTGTPSDVMVVASVIWGMRIGND